MAISSSCPFRGALVEPRDALSIHEFMLLRWESVKTSGGSRNERLQAGGFHASRTPGSIHYRMTFLMAKRSLLVNELTKGVTKSAHHIACFAASQRSCVPLMMQL